MRRRVPGPLRGLRFFSRDHGSGSRSGDSRSASSTRGQARA
jgi:hypothetical protein